MIILVFVFANIIDAIQIMRNVICFLLHILIIRKKYNFYYQMKQKSFPQKSSMDQTGDQQKPNLEYIRKQLKQCKIHEDSLSEIKSPYRSGQTKKSVRLTPPPESRYKRSTELIESSFIIKTSQQKADESAQCLMIQRLILNSPRLKGTKKKTYTTKNRKKKGSQLKNVIMNQKATKLKEVFCNKIRKNNQYSQPIQYQYEQNQFDKNILNFKGLELKQSQEKVLSILTIYNIVSSILLFTILLVFPQLKNNIVVKISEIVSILIILTQIVLNFITVKFSLGKKLEKIKQISQNYLKHKFSIDILNFFIIIVYIITEDSTVRYFRIIMMLKIPDCIDKIEKLEIYFIQNYYNQQYWSLFKVFLFNYCFAHMLAILLIAMSNVNSHSNWLINKGIAESPWYEQYIWSYYWATTIMLTIGFGDIIPSCYQQALCMIFIETISCMVLAYNINCIGSLISNIRSRDIEKSKSMKIFKKLVDKNGINQQLSSKINNYIEEHTNIKKLFNIEEEAQFVSKLPTAFRNDYLKQANKIIFQKIFFFNNLLQKTLFSLAQKIQMKIAHPQEIISGIQKTYDIFILKNGEVGYFSSKSNRKYSKHIFDNMKVNENDAPFLLNTNFITKCRLNYGIKSIVYSILYYLQYESLLPILEQSHVDYQLYCQERDKHKKNIDEYEVIPCQFCYKQLHTKFSCSKLHFIPISEHVKARYLHEQKKDKNERITAFERIQIAKQSSLSTFFINNQIYEQKKKAEIASYRTKQKEQRFVLDQLFGVDDDTSNIKENLQTNNINMKRSHKKTNNSFEDFAKLQAKFFSDTSEIIKTEINKSLGFKQAEDDVWALDLDRMKNYKNYFAKNNACNLTVTYNSEEKRKKLTQDNVYRALLKAFGKETFTTLASRAFQQN